MRYRTLYKWFQSSMFSMDSWSSQYAWLVTWISGYLESVIVYFPNCSIAARIAIYILSKCSALSDTTCGYMSRCPSVWNFIPAFPGGGNMVASWYSIIDLVFSPLSALYCLCQSVTSVQWDIRWNSVFKNFCDFLYYSISKKHFKLGNTVNGKSWEKYEL